MGRRHATDPVIRYRVTRSELWLRADHLLREPLRACERLERARLLIAVRRPIPYGDGPVVHAASP